MDLSRNLYGSGKCLNLNFGFFNQKKKRQKWWLVIISRASIGPAEYPRSRFRAQPKAAADIVGSNWATQGPVKNHALILPLVCWGIHPFKGVSLLKEESKEGDRQGALDYGRQDDWTWIVRLHACAFEPPKPLFRNVLIPWALPSLNRGRIISL